jgi:ADP-heptose:LPS heptosyltransferase
LSWFLDGRPLRRILVTRLRYLGDIAMSTVVLAALRRGDPDVQLGYLCEDGHAALLAGHPELARLHALSVRRTGRDAAARRAPAGERRHGPTAGTLAMIGQLRRARYDLAVDLLFNPRSAWLLQLTGVPARIGGVRRGYRRRLYTHLAPSPATVERPGLYRRAAGGLGEHLSRLAPLQHADGRSFLDWFEQEVRPGELRPLFARPPLAPAARELCERHDVANGRFILLAPTATWPTKAWPAAHWVALATGLQAAGHPVVVLTAPGTRDLANALGAALGPDRGLVLPPLPLAAALSVVAAARLIVSVDGGIMHAAVAMGVPTVALFGPTDPGLWFPYETLGPYRVLATRPACHPCHLLTCDAFVCLPDLVPARVQRAVQALLDGGAA